VSVVQDNSLTGGEESGSGSRKTMREELFIHQYKFSNWMPSAVKALATDKYSGIVAVGRQDGEIEV
jgi:hypothetical protein